MTAQSFAERLGSLSHLSDSDVDAILSMPWSAVSVKRGRDILSVEARPDYVYVIESGWAARYGIRSNGSRRITGFMLPGDFCGIHATTDEPMDHAIVALSSCEVARISKATFQEVLATSPAISTALWRAKLSDEAILRMWLLNSQEAAQALAHLLCELHARAEATGLAHEGHFAAPLTQEHLGDAIGTTSVHTNRIVKLLREAKLATIGGGEVVVHDIKALQSYCGFSPAYLHLPARSLHAGVVSS